MKMTRVNILAKFGEAVRRERLRLNLSQEELGFRAGLDRTYISGVERGVRNPSLTAIVKIAVGLNMEVAELTRDLR